MSDGPSKAAPEAEPLDDIILGDDDATEIVPTAGVSPPIVGSQPPPPRGSARPPDRPSAPPPVPTGPPRRANDGSGNNNNNNNSDRPNAEKRTSSNRMKAVSGSIPIPPEPGKDPKESQGRKRAKMTLRIPDDEISRPTLPATTPSGGIPALSSTGANAVVQHSNSNSNSNSNRPPSTPDEPTMPLVRPLTGPPPAGFNTHGGHGHGGGPDDTLELPADELRARAAALELHPSDGFQPVAQPVAPPQQQQPKPGTTPPPPHAVAAAAAAAAAAQPALGVDASHEPGWTPFQPEARAKEPDRSNDGGVMVPTAIININSDPRAGLHGEPGSNGGGGGTSHTQQSGQTLIDPQERVSAVPITVHDSTPPVSDEIPVDMDLGDDSESNIHVGVPHTASDEVATHPRLPLDSEEIRIDDGDRISETGEVEVAPEDLVSVESLPTPVAGAVGGGAAPPLKTAGKYPAFKDGEPAAQASPGEQIATPQPTPTPTTASALMQGVPPVASPSRPAMNAVTPPNPPTQTTSSPPPAPPVVQPTPQAPPVMASPVAQMPPVAPVAPPAAQSPTPMTAPPTTQPTQQAAPPQQHAARRQSNPLIFVPPVGALAPPPMTDTAAHRKKVRPWWEELFNDDFIRTMAKVTDAQIGKEVNFIEESLGCEGGAMILDLACGTGRHAVELAARGYQVVGFDLSLAMLARASDEAQDRKQKINFVQGDMREMTFEETFDGVYSWNTSFGYFDEEKNGAVIARVHKSLKKGGQFLLDVVNRDYIIKQAPSLAWFEGDGCICMDEMTIDFITSRMKVKRTLMMDDGRTKEIEYSVRVYALHELGKMLHDNGFRVAEVSGRTGTPGVFFGCESPRTLILAEKR